MNKAQVTCPACGDVTVPISSIEISPSPIKGKYFSTWRCPSCDQELRQVLPANAAMMVVSLGAAFLAAGAGVSIAVVANNADTPPPTPRRPARLSAPRRASRRPAKTYVPSTHGVIQAS